MEYSRCQLTRGESPDPLAQGVTSWRHGLGAGQHRTVRAAIPIPAAQATTRVG